jgi:hypothetical protein
MDDPITTLAVKTADGSVRPVLVVHPRGHGVALTLIDRLKTFGIAVRALANVYDAVVNLARDPQSYAAAVMAVDFFNRDELKFFSIAARRWPDLPTAAIARPAFAFKADMADLAGARAVCTDEKEIDRLFARIGLRAGVAPDGMANASAAEVAEAGVEVVPSSRPPEARPVVATSLPLTELPAQPEIAPADNAPAAPDRRPPALNRELPTSPHDILTEAEITALLENLDEEDEPDDD